MIQVIKIEIKLIDCKVIIFIIIELYSIINFDIVSFKQIINQILIIKSALEKYFKELSELKKGLQGLN